MSDGTTSILDYVSISSSDKPQIINLTNNLPLTVEYIGCRIVLLDYPTTCYIDDLNLTIL